MSLTSRETSNSGLYRGEGSELDRGIAQPYSPPRNPAPGPRNLPPTGKYMGKLTSDEEHIILLEKKCSEFMNKLPNIRVMEHEDTALAARDIARDQTRGVAAICSRRAAEIYGLEILAEGIETNKHNYTRFLIFAQPWIVDHLQKDEVLNKASIVFTVQHMEGSLSHVLSVFSFYSINLTKIQSLPIIGREWEYQFYVDLTFADITRFHQSLHAIRPLTNDIIILGEYIDGRQSQE